MAYKFKTKRIKKIGIALAKMLGRYAYWGRQEDRMEQAQEVWFQGDCPRSTGLQHFVRRVIYTHPHPVITHAEKLTYTPSGMAWVNGRLERRYSFRDPSLRDIWLPVGRAKKKYEQATILQSQTPCTYGDWMSEHVCSLARALAAGGVVEPLFLIPEKWFIKPYVKRDLELLGVRAEGVRETVWIRHATVLNKTRSGHHWVPEEAQAVLRALKIDPPECKPGSALYLSRFDEKGEGPRREIRNTITEAAMAAAGVRIVRTAGRTLEEYKQLAAEAETVFADHGAACYNMIYWRPSRMVEFFPPDYWDPSFLFLADSLGIRDYHLWRIDEKTTVEGLTRRIEQWMSAPQELRVGALTTVRR